ATEDVCFGRPVTATGEKECFCFGDHNIGCAVLLLEDVPELKCTAGSAWVQYDDLPIFKIGCASHCKIVMTGCRNYNHDDVRAARCFCNIACHQCQRAKHGSSIPEAEFNTSPLGDCFNVL